MLRLHPVSDPPLDKSTYYWYLLTREAPWGQKIKNTP